MICTTWSPEGEVVGVSFSHRAGATGHLYLAEIGGEEYAESGNVGTLDMVLALEWIRDNIAAFGGDPDRVLLYGCSGCGSETTILSGVPAAERLFHRAVISDGFMQWGLPAFYATMVAERMLDALGIGEHELHKLHDVPVQQVHDAIPFETDLANALTAPLPFQTYWHFYPVTDGVVLPRDPYGDGSPACSACVPMLMGFARDSLNMIACSRPWIDHLDEPGLRVFAENHVGPEHADAVLDAERRAAPGATPSDLAMAILNHRWMLAPWTRMAEQRVTGASAATYLYRFDYTTPAFGGTWGAVHGGEFSFFLNNVDGGGYGPQFMSLYAERDDRHDLQKVLNESFVRFAVRRRPVDRRARRVARPRPRAARGDGVGQSLPRRRRSARGTAGGIPRGGRGGRAGRLPARAAARGARAMTKLETASYSVTDSFFGAPYIEVDEERDKPYPHRFVQGGFEDTTTLFAFYFPPEEDYEGRMFQPLEGGNGGHVVTFGAGYLGEMFNTIKSTARLGGYLVESNQGHIGDELDPRAGPDPTLYGHRASTEVARFSKHVAAQVYGAPPAPLVHLRRERRRAPLAAVHRERPRRVGRLPPLGQRRGDRPAREHPADPHQQHDGVRHPVQRPAPARLRRDHRAGRPHGTGWERQSLRRAHHPPA